MSNQLLLSCGPAALLVAYLLTGIVFAAMYVPKLRCMIRDPQSTATAYSATTEWLWMACRLVSLLYVVLVAQDAAIAAVVSLDLIGRVASLLIVLRARRMVTSARTAFVPTTLAQQSVATRVAAC